MRLIIDSKEGIEFAEKLKTFHRSAFPVAIRGTLNDAAFKLKKEKMPKKSKELFKERQPNFFKANSKVDPATGFDINSMASTAGFVSSGLHNKSTNYAVKDLEDQEIGGTIKGRSFKPLPGARKGGTGNVRANSRISQILKAGNIIDVRDSKSTGSSNQGTHGSARQGNANNYKMQQFIKASIHAGEGGYVLGGNILWKVTKIRRTNYNQTTEFKKQKLYSFKKSGTAKVHARGLMRKSALEVQKEMEFMFKLQAMKQINKALKK